MFITAFHVLIGLPFQGVFTVKEAGQNKAREHALLISERPAYVTILTLVRDAVARLPNGEGTRADVSLLETFLCLTGSCCVTDRGTAALGADHHGLNSD